MQTPFTLHDTVGGIVTKFPKASDVFKAHKIDFCCGGNRPLSEAVSEKNLDADQILSELTSLYEKMQSTSDVDWKTARYSDLIDHVVQKHHGYLNEELPQLSAYVTKIFRVHGNGHPELKKVHELFHKLKTELEQHIIKEETEVFPLVYEYEKEPSEALLDKVLTANNALEAEHEDAGDLLKEIREVTSDFALPADACSSYRLTYQRLEELESDMFQHVHLENNILFPRLSAEKAS